MEAEREKAPAVFKIDISVGADTPTRYVRFSAYDDLLTQDQLEIWPKGLLDALQNAIGTSERLTTSHLTDRYLTPPPQERSD